MSFETTIARVKSWIVDKKPELADIDLDFDLIENRAIDSLLFLEFLYFLEELIGRELENGDELVRACRTLRTIERDIIHGTQAR